MAEYSGRDKRLAYLFDAIENVQVDDMTGASASTDGAHGLAPAPLAGDEDKFLKGDGTWATVQAGAGALSGLSDVDLSSPTDGQALVYDGTNSKWINGNVSGGGNTLVIQDASIYSEDEQQVGVWIDGKPLYERTFDLGSNVIISYNTLTNTTIDASNMQTLVNAWGLYSTGVTKYSLMANISNNVIRLQTDRNGADASVRYVILQYTKTTDAAGSGGYKAYGLSPIIYSTEEREVGVWTDGKPLYQKTLYYNEHLYGDINKDVTALNIDTCVDISGMTGEHSQWGYCTTFGYARQSSSANITALYNSQNKQLQLRFGSDYSSSVYFNGCNITLLYTKTTDTAGSGTWTTTGEYAHHYSTSEKVIGTWIDGKPLYERVWVNNGADITLNSGAWTAICSETWVSNIKFLTDAIVSRQGYTSNSTRLITSCEVLAETGTIKINPFRNTTFKSGGSIIIQYTKTTD